MVKLRQEKFTKENCKIKLENYCKAIFSYTQPPEKAAKKGLNFPRTLKILAQQVENEYCFTPGLAHVYAYFAVQCYLKPLSIPILNILIIPDRVAVLHVIEEERQKTICEWKYNLDLNWESFISHRDHIR